jgi:hypothetical protein
VEVPTDQADHEAMPILRLTKSRPSNEGGATMYETTLKTTQLGQTGLEITRLGFVTSTQPKSKGAHGES